MNLSKYGGIHAIRNSRIEEYLRTNPVFVIVCIKNSKEQIYSKLKEFGMTMFNDFVPYTEFDEDSIDSEQLKYVKAEKYIEQRRKKRKKRHKKTGNRIVHRN